MIDRLSSFSNPVAALPKFGATVQDSPGSPSPEEAPGQKSKKGFKRRSRRTQSTETPNTTGDTANMSQNGQTLIHHSAHTSPKPPKLLYKLAVQELRKLFPGAFEKGSQELRDTRKIFRGESKPRKIINLINSEVVIPRQRNGQLASQPKGQEEGHPPNEGLNGSANRILARYRRFKKRGEATQPPQPPATTSTEVTGVWVAPSPSTTATFVTPTIQNPQLAETGVMPSAGANNQQVDFSTDSGTGDANAVTGVYQADPNAVTGQQSVQTSPQAKPSARTEASTSRLRRALTWTKELFTGAPKTEWDKQTALPYSDMTSVFGHSHPMPSDKGVKQMVQDASNVKPKKYDNPIALTTSEAEALTDYYEDYNGLPGSFGYMVNMNIQQSIQPQTLDNRAETLRAKARPSQVLKAAQSVQSSRTKMPNAYAQSLGFHATFDDAIDSFLSAKVITRIQQRLEENKRFGYEPTGKGEGRHYMLAAEAVSDVLSGNPYRTNAWLYSDPNAIQHQFDRSASIANKAQRRLAAFKETGDEAAVRLEAKKLARHTDSAVTRRLLTTPIKNESKTWGSQGHQVLAEEIVNHLTRLYPDQKFLSQYRPQAVAHVKERLAALELGLATNVIQAKRQKGTAENVSDPLSKAQAEILADFTKRPETIRKVTRIENEMVAPVLEQVKKGQLTPKQAFEALQKPFEQEITDLYGDVMGVTSLDDIKWRLDLMKKEANKTPVVKLGKKLLSTAPLDQAKSVQEFDAFVKVLKRMNSTSSVSFDPRSDQTRWDATGLTEPIKSAWYWTGVKRWSTRAAVALALVTGTGGGVAGYNNVREQARIAEANRLKAVAKEGEAEKLRLSAEADKKAKALALKRQEEDLRQRLNTGFFNLTNKTDLWRIIYDAEQFARRKQDSRPFEDQGIRITSAKSLNGDQMLYIDVPTGGTSVKFSVPFNRESSNGLVRSATYIKPGDPRFPKGATGEDQVIEEVAARVSSHGELSNMTTQVFVLPPKGSGRAVQTFPPGQAQSVEITNERRAFLLGELSNALSRLTPELSKADVLEPPEIDQIQSAIDDTKVILAEKK